MVVRLFIVVALRSQLCLCGFRWTLVIISYWLCERLVDTRLCLELEVSLFSSGSISVQPTNRAHKTSFRLMIGSVACLICSSTDLRVSSSADVSVTGVSIPDFFLNLSSVVLEGLASVWVPISNSWLNKLGGVALSLKKWNWWNFWRCFCISEDVHQAENVDLRTKLKTE